MNNRSKIIITFLVLLLSVSAVLAHEECEKMGKDKKACPPVMQNGPMKMMHGDEKECMACMKMDKIVKHAKEIGLSEEQIAKISDLETNCKKDMIKKQADIGTLKVDKQAILKKDNAELPEVKKIIEKIAVLEGEIEYLCVENSAKVKKVLTEEQMKKLHEIVKTGKAGGEKHENKEKHEHNAK